ncbi:MAG: AraC family transcriptional regulator [Clostridiaceae bacterium]|nr:AraC family transcriptional regulator [Clostridiaceae bacterium]
MDYGYLDKEEYKDIPLLKIEENRNDLPFFIARLNRGNNTKHRHEFVQIAYISKGRLKHVINDNAFDVFRGDIFVIPPFVPHYYIDEYQDNYELVEFEFIPEFINERFSDEVQDTRFMDFAYLEPFLVTENEMKPRLNLSGSVQTEVEKILAEILAEYDSRDMDFSLMIKALLLKLLILVEREFKSEIAGTEYQGLYERHREAISCAIQYVDEHYAQEITIDEAARISMLSQSYFRYLFKQITHRTFTEYVQNLRINKAIDLLRSRRDMKIIDICYSVGFNNVSHFNRTFRQETGVSPKAFRSLPDDRPAGS